jgi:hypothetical protein
VQKAFELLLHTQKVLRFKNLRLVVETTEYIAFCHETISETIFGCKVTVKGSNWAAL